MDMNSRKMELRKIAQSMGIVENFVRSKLKQVAPEQEMEEKKIDYAQMIPIPTGAKFASAGAVVPKDPFGPNGEVNIMFQFRWVGSTDLKKAPPSTAGINTVIVYADGKGLGGGKSAYVLGNPKFINNAVSTIINKLKQENPNAKLGKLGFSSFSGGYGPTSVALGKVDQLVKEPDAVIVADGMHHSTRNNSAGMKPWVNYARKASKDPNKKFVVMHTGVKPQSFTSTTQTANYLLKSLDMQRKEMNPELFRWNVAPKSGASKGGFHVYEIPGGDGNAHITAGRSLPYMWRSFLGDWNQSY